jgi:N-acetyl sugar amidotransferase
MLEAKYGLPADVAFCKKCVMSNQRPNSAIEYQHTKESKKQTINFDAEGVCDACRMAEQKKKIINWDSREKELRSLCDRYRKIDGSYDCIVSGSGGKDSFYTTHVLKYQYHMHPLAVTWAPHMYTEWGWKNFQAWIHDGFDSILFTPNGKVHRLLTRLALENLLHPFQPFIIGQKSLAPKVAIRYNVPLIFYGENEAEYGNPLVDNKKAQRDWSYFTAADKSQVFLSGVSVQDLQEKYGVVTNDLEAYLPADPNDLKSHNIEVHYLGYYLPWHPQSVYYAAAEHGFRASPERTLGTYSKYSSIDDKIDDFHYYTTYIKFGIGRATYDAAQEIRSGDINREEGIRLVKRFDGEWPERFATEVFDYLSIDPQTFPQACRQFSHPLMDVAYFNTLADTFRSPHLWEKRGGKWQLRYTIY